MINKNLSNYYNVVIDTNLKNYALINKNPNNNNILINIKLKNVPSKKTIHSSVLTTLIHGRFAKTINHILKALHVRLYLYIDKNILFFTNSPLSLTISFFSFTPLNSPYPHYLSQKKFGAPNSKRKMCTDQAFSCYVL